MSDHTQVGKIITDIVQRMSFESLEWYHTNVTRLAEITDQPFEQVHKLILTMRNQ
jgi:hypothetical protein